MRLLQARYQIVVVGCAGEACVGKRANVEDSCDLKRNQGLDLALKNGLDAVLPDGGGYQ